MEETRPDESMIRRALRTVLGGKAEQVPLTRSELEQAANERRARERAAQIASGVTPKSGRGSNGGTTPLPEGVSWRPHVGRRQRERGLRQAWAQFEKLCRVNPWYATTRERLLDAVQDEPDAEYAAMNIALGAKLASDQKKEWLRQNPPPPSAPPMVEGVDWVDALNHALNQWEKLREVTAAQAAADGAAL
jgi:hypothetical protein